MAFNGDKGEISAEPVTTLSRGGGGQKTNEGRRGTSRERERKDTKEAETQNMRTLRVTASRFL